MDKNVLFGVRRVVTKVVPAGEIWGNPARFMIELQITKFFDLQKINLAPQTEGVCLASLYNLHRPPRKTAKLSSYGKRCIELDSLPHSATRAADLQSTEQLFVPDYGINPRGSFEPADKLGMASDKVTKVMEVLNRF